VQLLRRLARMAARGRVVARRCIYGFPGVVDMVPSLDATTLAWCLKHHGASIGANCRILPGLVIHNATESFRNLAIGDNVHIGRGCFLDLCDCIVIGPDVTVSMQSTILTHMDVGDIPLRRSAYPRFVGSVSIQQNTYLGSGVTVLAGCQVGPHAVVAAGAVVTGDVQSGCVVGGVPARVLRVLTPPETGAAL